jgi:hypothetical protein
MQLISLLPFSVVLTSQAAAWKIPNAPNTNEQVAEYTARADQFDGPKILSHPNASSYEWWYFDAVSATDNQSITVIFLESTSTSFLNPAGTFLNLQFVGTYPNGSSFNIAVPTEDCAVATITTAGDGASGAWSHTGFSFAGNPSATQYLVEVDNAEFGISGTMLVNSVC